MKSIATVGLVALSLIAGCGETTVEDAPVSRDGLTPEARAVLKQVATAVEQAEVAIQKFADASAKAKGPDEFAAALTALAGVWGPSGERLQALIPELAATGCGRENFDEIVNGLDPAIVRREAAFQAGCEKWADADTVQAALRTYLEANRHWEK